MRGMILAAGFGTRLRPLTMLRAKPAVPLHNRPLVCHAVDLLRRSGVAEIAVNLHHLPETVESSLSSYPDLRFSYEEQILGRGGALKQVEDFLADDTFVVCNGKIYLEQDLADVVEEHRRQSAVVTLVVVEWTPESPFNPVLLDGDGRIAGFGLASNPDWEDRLKPAVFTGVHVLEPGLLRRIPDGPSDTVGDLYPRLIAEGAEIRGFMSDGFWCESSTLLRYLDNSIALLAHHSISGLADAGATFPGTVTGPGCRVAGGAEVTDCILWENVTVEAGAQLARVIVTDDAHIPGDARYQDVVVTRRTANLEDVAGAEVRPEGELLIWPITS